jgi:hypothetical protein
LGTNRRDFMKAALGTASAASLSGCAGLLEGGESEDNEDNDPIDQKFQYAFSDKTGTLGNIPDSSVDPEEASSFQVIENGISENEWEEMHRDDVEVAEKILAGELESLPQDSGYEGTVDEIITRTEGIYNNPSSVEEEYISELIQEDDDEPVRFVRSLIHAVDKVTNIRSSGGKDMVIPNIAEHVAQELDLNFEDFNVSTVMGAEPLNGNKQRIIEESVRERPDGSKAGIRGTKHALSLLTYSKDGELETKYVENTDPSGQIYFFKGIRDPEESAYAASLEQERIEMPNGDVQFPEHYVTGLELEKGIEMESQGILEEGTTARSFVSAALHLVDDAQNNFSQLMANNNEGYDITLSDSFIESADGLAEEMGERDLKDFEQFGRAVYQIFENKLGEDYKGEPIRGYDQPLKIDGTFDEPEFYHLDGERPSE